MLESSDNSAQSINIVPVTLVDEVSSTVYYIGTSRSFKNQSAANWRIKKIWQDGTVWKVEFPNGDQSFIFTWTGRAGYTYS